MGRVGCGDFVKMESTTSKTVDICVDLDSLAKQTCWLSVVICSDFSTSS